MDERRFSMENLVENNEAEVVEADTQLETAVTEETDASETLDSVIDDQPKQPEETTSGSGTEPGWIKKRVGAAVDKAIRETEQRIRAEYDAKLAPLMERMLEQDALELVQSGKVKDLETAKELVRYRQGQPQPKNEQPRDENGRFSSNQDSSDDIRADMLAKQAQKVKTVKGVDVMSEFNRNEEVREKVLSGEWDFYDVAEAMQNQKAHRKAPAPMRSSNGASGAEKSTIASMTDEQFDRLNKRLEEGARFKV
jgi:hypothetical protein